MDLVKGITYNVRGLLFSLKSGKLLFWGLFRFALLVLILFLFGGLILAYHQDILQFVWARPESRWLLWLWHLVSWLLSLFLVGFSALFSFLLSQVLFSVLIMDLMSRITERKIAGQVREPVSLPLPRLFLFLLRQEIPRSVVPLILSAGILVAGWLVALGPIVTILSSALAIAFLAWDNTDLVPARRMSPFRNRFGAFMKTLLFHLGFGLPFLIPGLNLLFLSFAPVGATLYYLDRYDSGRDESA
ncbi:MAG: hypothetical protein JW821_02390 [Deltaproteobacteria bacterium]|nr:hypothetical protein [Deltaproteobacteria bacterium]